MKINLVYSIYTLKTRSSKAACCSNGGLRLDLTQGPKQGVDHALGSPSEKCWKKINIDSQK